MTKPAESHASIPVNIEVLAQAFDARDLEGRLHQLAIPHGAAGAVVTFIGQVRESGDRTGVTGLSLEHYPGMTERVLHRHVMQACTRWPLLGVVLVHRVGQMHLGENIVGVVVASAHRQAAFDAVQYLMDFLKHDAPFWKQELTADGASWVEQKDSDVERLKHW